MRTFLKDIDLKALVGTIVMVLLLFFLLFYLHFKIRAIEPEEGITINFGLSDNGMGEIETSSSVLSQETTITPQQTSVSAPIEALNNTESVNTQNFEEAAAIKSQQKPKIDKPKDLKAEQDRKLAAEKVIAEKKKRIEEQKILEEQKQRDAKAAEIRNLAQNAFGGGAGSSNSASDGNNGKAGNQGSANGDPASMNRIGGGHGVSGGSFSLDGRALIGSLPQAAYSVQEEGNVVVEIRVDRNGNVVSATARLQGSTTSNTTLWKAAVEAAKKAKFNVSQSATAVQVGTITYHFRLN